MLPIDLDDPGVLLRADVLDDPTAFHETLRRDAPVWRIPGQDSYVVSSPSLVREVVRRTDDFSSNLVSLVHNDGSGRPIPFAMAPFRDPINVLSTADPPDHTAHRALLQPALSPAALAALEPTVQDIVVQQFAPLLAAKRGDFVANFSEMVPARTICAIIGIPDAEAARAIDLVAGTGALLDGITDPDGMVAAMGRAGELYVFVSDQLRRALDLAPDERTGLLAVLGEGIADGTFTERDVHSALLTLLSAGSDTTASLLATATERLARDQELQSTLRRDPSLLPDAIDDVLRAAGPFQFHYRFVPHDTVLGGVEIPADSRVMVMWAAANLAEPDATAVGDRLPPHFAFGRGIHFCIGAPVARMEAGIALKRVLSSTTSIRLDPDRPPTRRPSIFMRRHRTLHLEIDPA
jgi:cytochrome P450